jgi:hypothetical protein
MQKVKLIFCNFLYLALLFFQPGNEILQLLIYRDTGGAMMRLADISDIFSGHITRGKIEAANDGSHYLVQARDVDAERLTYRTDQLIRFHPTLSRIDRRLEKGDLLFMARGAHNFTIALGDVPGPALAAACFFIIRLSDPGILPGYLGWYLNQAPVAQYLFQYSGRGVHMPVVRRAVLEDIEVPLPPKTIQAKVSNMNDLLNTELNLLQRLAQKRRTMVTAACLQTIQAY